MAKRWACSPSMPTVRMPSPNRTSGSSKRQPTSPPTRSISPRRRGWRWRYDPTLFVRRRWLSSGRNLMSVLARTLRYPVLASCLLTLAFVAGDSQSTAGQVARRPSLQRLDGTLRNAVAGGERTPQRVIIRVRSGQRAAVRRMLEQHEDAVVAEHGAIEALTAVVHGDDLAHLAQNSSIVSVSTDAVVRPHLLGGLLGIVGGLVGGVLQTVGGLLGGVVGILDPTTHTQGPEVPPAVLRATLGIDTRWTGRGVGVAVIDSGLEMSAEFQGRVNAFYDFTGGKPVPTFTFDVHGYGP